jgi:hypothetical protein
MNKSSFFSGQPLLAQILKLIPRYLINEVIRQFDADRYYKKFKSYDHLVAMLYCCMHDCTSLRELVTGMQAHYNKLAHLDVNCIPRRSTLADANKHRDAMFFESLYRKFYQHFYGVLPDSLTNKGVQERIFLMDSTTISLFSDILRGAGMYGFNGKKKGGAKAHVLLNIHRFVPELIYITDAKENDRIFMSHIDLPPGAILVFDRGYQKFSQWDEWTQQGLTWITRIKENQYYQVHAERPVKNSEKQKGVLRDQEILLGRGTKNTTKIIRARLVTYLDRKTSEIYEFVTNNMRFNASTIAAFYKQRWQIETFFKQYKQNNPVKYFLGDSENAIKIQLWVAFIKELLIKVVKDRVKRKWSHANLSCMIRHHLMNYINLFAFLNDPDRAIIKHLKYAIKPPDLFSQ